MSSYSDYSDYPREYVASRFSDWIYVITGTAIIRAQYVERVLNGICLLLGTQGLKVSSDDFLSEDPLRTRQTLGMIERQLRGTQFFDPHFSERLQEFTRRRNRIVHDLYASSFHSNDEFDIESPVAQGYVQECEWLAQEAPRLVEIAFGLYRVLGRFLKPDHPEYTEMVAALRGFDEFYERGLNALAPNLRPHFDRQTLQ